MTLVEFVEKSSHQNLCMYTFLCTKTLLMDYYHYCTYTDLVDYEYQFMDI